MWVLLLTTALLQLQVTYSREQVGVRASNEDLAPPPHPGHTPSIPEAAEGDETFMDSLVWEGRDMTATFVLETLQGLHMQSVACNMNMSAVEMKHAKELEKMLKYYHSMEKLVSSKQYMKFSKDDRSSVETNFHSTMKHHEKTRNHKLQKIKAQCDSQQEAWLNERFASAVTHARTLVDAGRGGRGQYQTMEARLRYCRQKIQQHLATCRSRANSFGLLYCYVDELDILVRKLDELLATMQEIFRVHYGDDEDLITTGSGGGGGTRPPDTTDLPFEDESIDVAIDPRTEDIVDLEQATAVTAAEDSEVAADTTPTIVIHKISLPPDFLGKRPVILDTPTNTTAPETTPTTETMPTVSTKDMPSPSSTRITTTNTPKTTPTTTETTPTVSTKDTPSLEEEEEEEEELRPISSEPSSSSETEILVPGSPVSDTAKDSTQMPSTHSSTSQGPVSGRLEPAFEEVTEGKNEGEASRSDSSSSSSKAGSNSGSRKAGKSLGGSLEVDIEGSRGEVDIAVSIYSPVVDLDPDSLSDDEEEGEEEGDSWSYTTYILIYFFLGLAVILLVFGVVIVVMVAVWKTSARRRSGSATEKDPPLISEKETLDVMKKMGYVNPTYKFYSQS